MKRRHFASGVIVLLVGFICLTIYTMTDNTASPREAREAQDRIEGMIYERDTRTGLCYAISCWHDETLFSCWHNETRSISYVPCTPEVLSQIKDQR
jgi:hypothetical protein